MTSSNGGPASSWPSLPGFQLPTLGAVGGGGALVEASGGRRVEALHRQAEGTSPPQSRDEASAQTSVSPKTECREQTASKGVKIYHELITIGHLSSDLYKTPA